mgnify:CR=1 FL=1
MKKVRQGATSDWIEKLISFNKASIFVHTNNEDVNVFLNIAKRKLHKIAYSIGFSQSKSITFFMYFIKSEIIRLRVWNQIYFFYFETKVFAKKLSVILSYLLLFQVKAVKYHMFRNFIFYRISTAAATLFLNNNNSTFICTSVYNEHFRICHCSWKQLQRIQFPQFWSQYEVKYS